MSRLPFELLLGWRYLRPKRTFVSVITLISVLGVSLGVAVLIIVISVFTGFEHKLREKVLGFSPHLRVLERNHTMQDHKTVARSIAAHPHVRSVAPFVLGQVLVETDPPSGKPETAAPWIRGLDPAIESKMSVLPSSIRQGRFDVSNQGILIGIELAKQLKVKVGDRVLIYSPNDLAEWKTSIARKEEKIPLPPEYDVRGVFDVGYFEYNRLVIAGSLTDAQELYNLGANVHGLLVMLDDPYRAPSVRGDLEKTLGWTYQINTWMEENESLLGQVVAAKKVQFYLLFFVMIVAALCILSALITFVVQKTREIGMLKALGATDTQIAGLFLSQSGFIAVLGIAAGLTLGRLALAYRNEFMRLLDRTLHAQLLPPSIYGFEELPALIVPTDILLICGSALLICLLGGVIPAWRAGRLKPVAALRHE